MTRISSILGGLNLCKEVVNVLEVRFANNELEKEDLEHNLKLLHAYLDILEKDVENM